ncbi:hypothetical protein [Magnetococcus sp. PR-3]|uniref:hypothetical protein n=1 Tax=Magnetococcus sp. PR-3 TaxID=3120355 RepID=UPI002FCE2A42
MWFKRIVSSNYTGLCNRLEGLVLCFACEDQFGHQVCIDWPEMDMLEIEGARTWRYNPIDKWMGLKIRDPSAELYHQLGKHRVLIQRGTVGGDPDVLDRYLRPAMDRVRLKAAGRARLRELFAHAGDAVVVGVHIRRGDFQQGDPSRYDIHATRHPQVPLWWYQHAMAQMKKRYGQVAFFLSHNNLSSEEEALLRQEFQVLPSLATGSFNAGGGHASASNPVLDLFALATTPVVIATPMSSFSHYAANVLGPASLAIQPLPVMSQEKPGFGMSTLYNQRVPAWFDSLRDGGNFQPIESLDDMPDLEHNLFLDWLDHH